MTNSSTLTTHTTPEIEPNIGIKQIEQALKLFQRHDYKALGGHALADLALIQEDLHHDASQRERGIAVADLIDQIIEAQRRQIPARPGESLRGRIACILAERYKDGASLDTMYDRLHVSKGTYNEAQRESWVVVRNEITRRMTLHRHAHEVKARCAVYALPLPPPYFLGREDLLQQIKIYLGGPHIHGSILDGTTTSARRIVGITGEGGTGKTALALMVGQQVRQQYPDAHLFLNLQLGDIPMAPTTILGLIIGIFRPLMRLPKDIESLQSLCTTVMRHYHGLLILDNAASEEQIMPLLSLPAEWAILFTARRQLALDADICVHSLDLLPSDAAASLLRTLLVRGKRTDIVESPTGDTDLARLAAAGGYLPLALESVAGLLLSSGAPTVDACLNRIAHDRLGVLGQDDSAVVPILKANIDQLAEETPESAIRWPAVAIFPGPFDAAAAAAVWDVPIQQVVFSLKLFAMRYLITYEQQHERFRTHDLLRDVARQRLAEEDGLRYRHAQYYAKRMDAANTLFRNGSELQGLSMFDADRTHIDHAWEWVRNQEPSPETDLILIILGSANELGEVRYPIRNVWIPRLMMGLAAAQRCNETKVLIKFLAKLGIAHMLIGEAEQSISYFRQSTDLSQTTGDQKAIAIALTNQSQAEQEFGRYHDARETLLKALSLIQKGEPERHGEGFIYNALGISAEMLFKVNDALHWYNKALLIFQEVKDSRGEAATLANIGNTHLKRGMPKQAIEMHQRAIAKAGEVTDDYAEALSSQSLAEAYACLSQFGAAVTALGVTERYFALNNRPDLCQVRAQIRVVESWCSTSHPVQHIDPMEYLHDAVLSAGVTPAPSGKSRLVHRLITTLGVLQVAVLLEKAHRQAGEHEVRRWDGTPRRVQAHFFYLAKEESSQAEWNHITKTGI